MKSQHHAGYLAATILPTTYGNVHRREYTRDVPKTFDGGDIDDNGHWRGAEMGCLECRTTRRMVVGPTATYLLSVLRCGECGERFAEFWQ